MAFAAPKIPDGSELRLRLSSWTPLNHQRINDKVFEERRALLGKWFDKWTDSQRRRILAGFAGTLLLVPAEILCPAAPGTGPHRGRGFYHQDPSSLVLVHLFLPGPTEPLQMRTGEAGTGRNLSELDQLWMLSAFVSGGTSVPAPRPWSREPGSSSTSRWCASCASARPRLRPRPSSSLSTCSR
uniref:Uncharacterized protein n=1 Tax=Taeniopygia guttata TaxID=59729 RepID=A0A674GRG9_TAEGU